MKAAFLSLLAALAASVAFAKETLVAEYIVPIAEKDNWESPNKIWQGYNTPTKKGITFKRRDVAKNARHNYYLPELPKVNALGYWVESATTQAWLPEFYTRSITSADSPMHRYLYELHMTPSGVPGFYDIVTDPSKEVLGPSGEISSTNLEATVIREEMDSSIQDPKTGTAPYVQCIHYDYVYDVTFEANGGVGSAWTQPVTNRANLTANTFTRTGYSFANWNTQSDGKGASYKDGEEIAPKDDLTLYAQWKGDSVEVTFDPNGGTLSGDSSKNVTVGSAYGSMPSASMTGHKADLWYTAEEGGSKVTSGTIVTNASPHTLYAHWTRNSYKLAINFGPGIASVSYKVGVGDWQTTSEKCEVPVPYNDEWKAYAVAKSGYIADNPESNPKSGTMSVGGATFNATATETQYTVTYQPGDYGSGETHADKKNYTQTIELRGSGHYSRTGYSQTGWSRHSDGGIKDFNLGATYDGHVDITLYPFWTANTYAVRYNRNASGATGEMADSSHTYDTPSALTLNGYVRTGYTFAGWARTSSGEVAFADGAVVKNLATNQNATAALYAKWTANTYTVTLDPNGGTCATPTMSVTYGSTYGALPTASRRGYAFGNWYTASEGGERVYDYTTVSAPSNHNLYAHWTASIYAVHFYDDEGRVGTQTDFRYDQPKALRTAADMGCAKAGSDFQGWATNETDRTVVYRDGETVVNLTDENNGKVSLFAVFKPAPSFVAFNPSTNDVTGVMTVQECICGEETRLSKCAYARAGHSFRGWTETSGGHLVDYKDEAAYTPSTAYAHKTNTLYAVWKANYVKLTFEGEGGLFENGKGQLVVADRYIDGFPYDEFPVVTNADANVSFAGWWDTNDVTCATQQLTTANASITLKTLYARWKLTNAVERVAVTFEMNGGAGDDVVTNLVKGAEIGAAMPADPTRTGYRFVGWYSGKTDGKRVTKDTIAKNDTIYYARWSDTNIEAVFGEFDGLAFSTDATDGWYEDGDALRSGMCGTSTLTACLASEAGGTIAFNWKVVAKNTELLLNYDRKVLAYITSTGSKTEDIDAPDTRTWECMRDDILTASDGAWLSAFSWKPNPGPASPIAAWTNNPERANLVFETGGTKPWADVGTTGECIVSGAIGDGDFSWVRTTVTGPGTLSFRWRTDCEGAWTEEPSGACQWTDRLELRVDGAVVRIIGGTDAETNGFVQYSGGTHTYEWRYVKDADTSVGEDRAWLDDVSWTPMKGGVIYLLK